VNKHLIIDGQHYIIDIKLDRIDDLYDLEKTLNSMPGIVEHGLFLNMAGTLIVGKRFIR